MAFGANLHDSLDNDTRPKTPPPKRPRLPERLKDEKSCPFSDVKIECEGTTFYLLKGMLCLRSNYFRAMFTGGFKAQRESNQATIILHEKIEDAERLFSWIYDSHYPFIETRTDDNGDTIDVVCVNCDYSRGVMLVHATMYEMGKKYGISGLMRYSKEMFKRCLDWDYKEDDAEPDGSDDDACKLNSCSKLYTEEIFETAHVVYNTTPPTDRGLREPLDIALARNFSTFHAVNTRLTEVMVEHEDLCYNLLMHLGAEMSRLRATPTSEETAEPHIDALSYRNAEKVIKDLVAAGNSRKACPSCCSDYSIFTKARLDEGNMEVVLECSVCAPSQPPKRRRIFYE